MVLVHVTAFKGHHKIQDRWEDREYVVEKQPYPNVPVYVVFLRDWEGCSQTLHRNYLLPISPNTGQEHHLWIVSLLMLDHLGWTHQAQQVAHPRVVQISLLHPDVAPEQSATDFHGGTGILVLR